MNGMLINGNANNKFHGKRPNIKLENEGVDAGKKNQKRIYSSTQKP